MDACDHERLWMSLSILQIFKNLLEAVWGKFIERSKSAELVCRESGQWTMTFSVNVAIMQISANVQSAEFVQR